MRWWLLHAQAQNEGEYETIVANLQEQLQAGQKELWDAHQQVTEILRQDDDDEDASDNDEENVMDTGNNNQADADDVKKPAAVASSDIASTTTASTRTRNAAKKSKKTPNPPYINVVIVEGPYEGTTLDLKLTAKRSTAWVGRSKGAKFVDRGVSLLQDSEVSTSHGRFEVQRGKYYYTDVASTNGSLIGNEYLEPNALYEIEDGMYITVGQTVMQVTVVKK